MGAFTKKIFLLTLGWTLIFIGFIGLFLPFLQGILFIMIGLVILSKHSKTAQHFLVRLQERHPAPFKVMMEWQQRVSNRYHRWANR